MFKSNRLGIITYHAEYRPCKSQNVVTVRKCEGKKIPNRWTFVLFSFFFFLVKTVILT